VVSGPEEDESAAVSCTTGCFGQWQYFFRSGAIGQQSPGKMRENSFRVMTNTGKNR
jgi:hypothetical protein